MVEFFWLLIVCLYIVGKLRIYYLVLWEGSVRLPGQRSAAFGSQEWAAGVPLTIMVATLWPMCPTRLFIPVQH